MPSQLLYYNIYLVSNGHTNSDSLAAIATRCAVVLF